MNVSSDPIRRTAITRQGAGGADSHLPVPWDHLPPCLSRGTALPESKHISAEGPRSNHTCVNLLFKCHNREQRDKGKVAMNGWPRLRVQLGGSLSTVRQETRTEKEKSNEAGS